MDSLVLVDVPANHQVMLTFLHLNLTGCKVSCDPSKVSLALYKKSIREDNMFWQCGQAGKVESPLKRKLLPPATNVCVQFRCRNSQKNGFRLYFSIHKSSAILTKVNAGLLWNCSVPYFNDFRLHFPCDMIPPTARTPPTHADRGSSHLVAVVCSTTL